MKAIINKNGQLVLEKLGGMIPQSCCKSMDSTTGYTNHCGIWCPLMQVSVEKHHNRIELCEDRVLKPKTIDVQFNPDEFTELYKEDSE